MSDWTSWAGALEFMPVAPLQVPGLADYARRWRAAAAAPAQP
jgi:hypothetical protein